MTEIAAPTPVLSKLAAPSERLRKRYAAERRFRLYGLGAVILGLVFLVALFASIVSAGYGAFTQTAIRLDVKFDKEIIDPSGERKPDTLAGADYTLLARNALRETVGIGDDRQDRRLGNALLSKGADVQLRDKVLSDPSVIGTTQPVWLWASGDVDAILKDPSQRKIASDNRRLNDRQLGWLDALAAKGQVAKRFNSVLFTSGASSDPELAGIGVAAIGSLYMMLIVLLTALPIGVAAAIYLEEFAPKNRWTDLIEVNINNLAAVPSIVFGLLGLAIFINFLAMPRSAPVVGGLVLSLMTLPVIIIATRAAVKAVPPSIREAALGVGASQMQTVTHHVLPLALPGILTGTIIGMARALGETAPLLLIGMVAFVVEYPTTPLDPATALPVQIYLWAGAPERGFVERTSAAIIVLLVFLILMNALAVFLRRKFERRW